MPPSGLVGLAILPAIIWASLTFVTVFPTPFARTLRSAWDRKI